MLGFAGFKISKDILTVLNPALPKSLADLAFHYELNYLFTV
jgi:trehalose/maltose hydrolase-like predicted phosphorylase